MKKILMLLFVICFAFSSCGKKEDSATIKPGIHCEIEGRTFEGDTINSYVANRGESFDIVAPQGIFGSGPFEGLSIYVKGNLKIGEFALTKEEDKTYATFSSNITKKDKKDDKDCNEFISSDGKVSILKVDESHAEGTININFISRFEDEHLKPLKINGKFNLKIIK